MQFKDTQDNLYYTEDDTLYVQGSKVNFLRKIGKISTNLTTGKCNLIIHRRAEEKTNLGWLISSAPLKYLDINTVVLIVDNDKIYILYWEQVKVHRKEWTFTPNNGMEAQMVIPDPHWSEVKQDTGIIVE